MAFQNKNLSVIAYANGFTLWHYAALAETMTTITTSGYFNDVKTLMNPGDLVIINASDKTGIRTIGTASGSITTGAIA